jgi:N-acetylglucosamine malate deacetylase 1
MKLNILAFGAHPDDVELSCSGTIIAHVTNGKTAGIIDLTAGEMGSRGTVAIRAAEAQAASKILGCSVRENLGLADGLFEVNNANMLLVVTAIRKYQPDIILCNAPEDRHPDHGKASKLVEEAAFLSGLIKIETMVDGIAQKAWRPTIVLKYIQDRWLTPDVVIDITPFWEQRMESIKAHRSQFFDPNSNEPATYIASQNFFDSIESRSREMGRSAQFKYAEGYISSRVIGVKSLNDLY